MAIRYERRVRGECSRCVCVWAVYKKKPHTHTKMRVMIGTLSAFGANEETREEYWDMLEQFFEATAISGERARGGPATWK